MAAVISSAGYTVGAACLLSADKILTCAHVISASLGRKPQIGDIIDCRLIGVVGQPVLKACVEELRDEEFPERDLALLSLRVPREIELAVTPMEFVTPLRHSGKRFSVFGFPNDTDDQGRNVTGWLHAADAKGLVQMDCGGNLSVEGGYSGAPVWSPDLDGFVGIVVSELHQWEISWCIPSRILCCFYSDLPVRFRIPPSDRPVIHDYWEDDPNVQLFGTVSADGKRKLTARVKERTNDYRVRLTYSCEPSDPPRGQYVTFITYPDFLDKDHEDAYELFSTIKDNVAENEIYPKSLFTVAAIGDAGETALTLNLETIKRKRQKPK